MALTVWSLKQGADRRIRSGHPWVFSNELSSSPKGLVPGTPIVLQDSKNQVVALGYGNPHSLIAFRALSLSPQEKDYFFKTEFIADKILKAWKVRKQSGFKGSARIIFGESDFLPGLVLDYYLLDSGHQVFAAQVLTAGLSQLLPQGEALANELFKDLVASAMKLNLTTVSWENTAVVLRNDVNIRKLEGLLVEPAKVIKEIPGVNLSDVKIVLNEAAGPGTITMSCNLFDGQKTGFFLDQTKNISEVCQLVGNWSFPNKEVRVLDLCCYVGHWSTQLTKVLKRNGYSVDVTQVDVSEEALGFAKRNAEAEGAKVVSEKLDVVHQLEKLATGYYDIVIADPPAFIKAKKDIPTGKHAYIKMNTQAFRMVKSGGLVVSCSCSGLLEEIEFKDAIRKAALRSGLGSRNLLRGGHAADHPTLMQFSEGSYLKMYTHVVDKI